MTNHEIRKKTDANNAISLVQVLKQMRCFFLQKKIRYMIIMMLNCVVLLSVCVCVVALLYVLHTRHIHYSHP